MHCSKRRYVLSALLVALLVLSGGAASAQNKSQLEKQKTQLEAEIKKLNNELSKAKKNTKLSQTQLNALNKKISERTKLIDNINGQMSILNQQIGQTTDSIRSMRHHIDSLKVEYAKVIRVLYKEHDNMDKMALLFDTPSYNKAFLRVKYFAEYSRYRRHQERVIHQREEELNTINMQLMRQKDEKNSLLAQEKKNKEQLTREQKQQQQTVNASRAKEKNLTAQLSKKEKQKRELDSKIKKLIAEEVAKANKNSGSKGNRTGTATPSSSASSSPSPAVVAASTEFSGNKGVLPWPVAYKSVLREFGRYTHASGGENVNNGIDLATASGATVSCVFKGQVTRVFTCPNGAQGVIVRHGEFMTVYANLASVKVAQGANVTAKQALGTVANGENGQGEMSFQIWKGTTPQNPRSWLR